MIRKVPFLTGAFTPLVTPFKSGAVDYDLYAQLIEWQIEQGTHGLLVNATSGEPTTLTVDEKARLIEVAVKTSAARKPVVAGIPSESHADAVTLLARAEKAGANAIVSVTPYYVRPPQRGLVAFFMDLANRSVNAGTFEAIAESCPNFVGLKNTASRHSSAFAGAFHITEEENAMSVQLVNDARRIAFYMEDDLHGIKQLAQAIFLIAEQIEYERCESILRIAHIMMDSASTLSRG